MKKIGILQKVDALYKKASNAIIGSTPMDGNALETTNTLQTLKNFTKHSIDRVKEVGLKQSFLTMGEPEEKDVLYKEVIKREKEEEKEIQKSLKEAKKASKELEKAKKKATEKALSKKKTSSETRSTVKKPALKKVTKKKPNPTKEITKKESSSKKTTTKQPKVKETENKTKNTATKKGVEKQSTAKKKPTTKPEPRGAKKAAKIALYIKDIKKHYGEVDEAFVAIIVKNLGPSIYKRDAELVSCSDPKELDTVRKNFLMKKLGINASQGVLDAAIQDVCEELKSTRTKYRATFYYSLAKKFKKESILS